MSNIEYLENPGNKHLILMSYLKRFNKFENYFLVEKKDELKVFVKVSELKDINMNCK